MFRDDVEWGRKPHPHVWFCSHYRDVVSPPFPQEGKQGLSVFVGPVQAFSDPQARLLWALEKQRGRSTAVILTGAVRGSNYLQQLRTLEAHLGDSRLLPTCLMRRKGGKWQSVDAFSSGHSPSSQGAGLRVKRIKQAAWELLVDRLCSVDEDLKRAYFETLEVDRETLLDGVGQGVARGVCSPVFAVTGPGLTGDDLSTWLGYRTVARILSGLRPVEASSHQGWLYLGKRKAGEEMILWGSHSRQALEVGQILVGASEQSDDGEFAVREVLQSLALGESEGRVLRVRVDWRYQSGRQIPTLWRQKTLAPAGEELPHG